MSRIPVALAALLVLADPVLVAAVPDPGNVNIEGVVKDAQTGELLPGSNVVLAGTSLGASSDIHGKYTIRNVPPGSYTLRATYVGYTPFSAPILVDGTRSVSFDFKLNAVAVEGQTVVVTAQALGQNQAINQQLASPQIVNVVSSARIQELPDANAAESVGRLPGVSVTREGGEGNQVVIRGLSPKYNQVMINGVAMAPTDAGDRGTDLSMISSSMLEGIEVTKAITPDMDAEVLGGTVNFKLREARETDAGAPQFGLMAQGAYNGLAKSYSDNYKVVGNAETRLLDNQFGVFAEFNAERKNLTSNEQGASYFLNSKDPGGHNPVYLGSLSLNDVLRDRERLGGTLVLDYRIPEGAISMMNLFSAGNTKTTNRGENYDVSVTGRSHTYSTSASENKLNVLTNLLEYSQTLPLFVVDAKLSHSYSENHDPNDISINFVNQNDGVSGPGYQRLDPRLIPQLAVNDLSLTKLNSISASSSFSRDRAIAGSIDILSPVRLNDDVTGSLKVGGKLQYRVRSYDADQSDGALLVSGGGLRQAILDAFPYMKQLVPTGVAPLPLSLFQGGGFSYGKILGGDYTMASPFNTALLQPLINVARRFGQLEAWSHNAFASQTNDYSGFEHQAGLYAMVTANLGEDITLLGGARYQNLVTSYTAPRGTETNTSHFSYAPRDTTINESHGRWLPMAHVMYRPFGWLQLRFAYTNTLTYPDYNTITPRIDLGFTSISWNNFALKESHSANYDLVLSVLDNTLGLFSVDGFYKQIDNLIFPVSRFVIDPAQYPGPPDPQAGYSVSTYFNDPYVVNLVGIEIDWQTHFWYLPGPLSGLVLSLNYTHIFSKAKYPLTTVNTTYSPDPPYVIKTYDESYYEARLLNQPDNIVNLAVGYDYGGFSTRVAMLYQADVFKGEDFYPELRSNTATYVRWDFSVKQALPWAGLQVFFDLNNFNNARDMSVNQGSGYPTAEQYYGLTADLGLRFSF